MSESSNLPEVYKVIGAPGTGKTTRVVGNPELPDVTSLVMENLKEYPIEEQMIVTYTNAGVDEAADRLEKILDAPRYKIDDRVRTIHSSAFGAIDTEDLEVVNWWNEQQFCNKYSLEYGFEDDDGDIMSSQSDEGHTLFQIYGWLKSNRKDLEEYQDCPVSYPGNDDPLELMHAWEEYKEVNDLIQFSDMIEKVVEGAKHALHQNGHPNLFGDNPESARETFKQVRHSDRFNPDDWRGRGPFPDTKVLYVDEVQDLTPLQWAWYLMAKLIAEKVYIGGDDDQTIYGWAGANPEFMLNEEGDFEVLDKTYRIPANIWNTCDGVIRQVDVRQEKDVTPHGEGGEVITMKSPSISRVVSHLEQGTCMVLFRANYMIDEFREDLHAKGIPYDNMSTYETWDDDVTTLRDALYKLKSGKETVSREEAEVMIDLAKREHGACGGKGCSECEGSGQVSMLADGNDFDAAESAMSSFGGVSVKRLEEIFDLSTRYRDEDLTHQGYLRQCDEINYHQKQAIKGNLRNGYHDMDPERVRLGTIHSAKGKEAETVVLATDTTETIVDNMVQDVKDKPGKNISDAERRLYYVGMTRASEKLIMAQGLVNREMFINISDLIADGSEHVTESAQSQWATQDTNYEAEW